MELAAQAEDARLSAGNEEARQEAENDQHPDVHRETGNDRTHGAEAQGVL